MIVHASGMMYYPESTFYHTLCDRVIVFLILHVNLSDVHFLHNKNEVCTKQARDIENCPHLLIKTVTIYRVYHFKVPSKYLFANNLVLYMFILSVTNLHLTDLSFTFSLTVADITQEISDSMA